MSNKNKLPLFDEELNRIAETILQRWLADNLNFSYEDYLKVVEKRKRNIDMTKTEEQKRIVSLNPIVTAIVNSGKLREAGKEK